MKYTLLLSTFFFVWYCSSVQAQNHGLDKAVLASATVDPLAPSVTLQWETPTTATIAFVIHRKTVGTINWGSTIASLPPSATSYTDTTVAAGAVYEYRIQKTGGTVAFGYLTVGVEHYAEPNTGIMLLLADSNYLVPLAAKINRWKDDVRREGWGVIQINVGRNMSPAAVKLLIQNAKSQYPALSTIFVLGHVPVPYSGNLYPDGHPDHEGAWPADVYYAELDGMWTDNTVNNTVATRSENHNIPGDGKFDQSGIPTSKLELEIGRVDLFNMPAFSLSDTVLVANYLDKNHIYRSGQSSIRYRAVVDDNFTSYAEGFAMSARTGFCALFGPDSTVDADYRTEMSSGNYQWSFGCGGGWYSGAGGIGSTSDFVGDSLRNVFTLLFGSYFGDWDSQNNYLRAPLASRGSTLANFWSGRPYLFIHPMAMGKHLGFCMKNGINNSLNYASSYGSVSTHIALMGDPSLTNYPEAGPQNFASVADSCGYLVASWPVNNTWEGYFVYASSSADSIFRRVIPTLVTSASVSVPMTGYTGKTYILVRPVKKIVNGSGIFFLEGRGMLDSIQLAPPLEVAQVVIQDDNGSCSGECAVMITGGSGNYSYQWSVSGPDAPVLEDLCAGNYSVTVTDDSTGCSIVVPFVIGSNVSVNEVLSEHVANIFPVPAHSEVTLQIEPQNTDLELALLDISGRITWTGMLPRGTAQYMMDFSGLARGSYILSIQQGTEKIFKRIVLD